MKGNAVSALVVAAALAIVAGVAWFRSTRSDAGRGAATPPVPVPSTNDTATGAAGTPAQNGDLCPKPPPPSNVSATQPASASAAATGPTAARKLPRVVDLGADKCKACKDLAPILEQLRLEYEGRITVEFIDVWKDPKAGGPYKIRVIPTQVFFDADGKEVWRHEGFLPKADFVKKFAELGVK